MWINCLDKKKPLFGMAALCTWLKIPILAGSLLEANYLISEPPLTASSPISLFPANTVLLCTQTTLTHPKLLLSGTILTRSIYCSV
jgi:hypothetical protein